MMIKCKYRIAHRIIATNSYLYKIKVKDSPLCTFCGLHEETIVHIFYECESVHNLWTAIIDWVYEKCAVRLNFTKLDYLFGKFNSKYPVLNLLIFLVNSYIYKQRCKDQKLYVKHFIQEIQNYQRAEKLIHRMKLYFGNST